MSEDIRIIANGLRFPEGPIAMPDGSVLLVEIERQTLTRVSPEGKTKVIAKIDGGPNGAAIGPDGAVYICNNGGSRWLERGDMLIPTLPSEDYQGGSIQRVDLEDGHVTTLYTHCGEYRLTAPNDLVFDRSGGFWFTDFGKSRRRTQDHGGVYYGKADGSLIREAIFPIDSPNGIGLSADEATLYIASTQSARIWAFDVAAPGIVQPGRSVPMERGRCIYGADGYCGFDSLAMDADGNLCVATLFKGGISVVSPQGDLVDFVSMPDSITTNICFGGVGLQNAYITLSGSGKLAAMKWPVSGLMLNSRD